MDNNVKEKLEKIKDKIKDTKEDNEEKNYKERKFIKLNDKELPQLLFNIFGRTKRKIIQLFDFKYGKESDDFKYFKQETVRLFHNQFIFLFRTMMELGFIERCECNGKLKDFPSECKKCYGIGFINKEKK